MKSLLERLGVAPEMTVSLVGVTDHEFAESVRTVAGEVYEHVIPKGSDIVFFQAESAHDLAVKLTNVAELIRRDGAIWVLWAKGRLRLKQQDVMAAGLAAGLVDVKVVGFSEVFSALKFVIPSADR
jgi:hypothetical protein